MALSDLTFSDPAIARRIAEWTSSDFDEATRREVQALVDAGNVKELEDRFYRTLEFGTGGLRGIRGAGTNRMNETIVAWATQGLANYVKAHATRPGPLRAAIAYDCRHGSREYALTAASVLAANGFAVHVSRELRPTPWLSFAIRELGCHTGIVVTASHNPKEYNGYKVYWDDGSQVVPPHDKGIIAEVAKITSNAQVQRDAMPATMAGGQLYFLGADMDAKYLAAIRREQFDAARCAATPLKIVYTPLHGAGAPIAVKALEDWGFRHVIPVQKQMIVDGDFPTAASPNPEEPAALELALQTAEREQADLVLATDPDGDRLGTAVRHRGGYRLLTGNQLCVLLCDWVLSEGTRTGRRPANAGVVTTIVTTPMFADVARHHGAAFAEVLTGFKWIARQIREWEAAGGPAYVYGAEESYGYMIGTHARDKDGIVASCVTAEMAADSAARGESLFDRLLHLFARHGLRHEWQKNITLPGREGAARIAAMLDRVRSAPPREMAGRRVTRFTRIDTGEIVDGQTGACIGRVELPRSDVFLFDLEGGARAIVRPSGTEPKIKFYFFLSADAPAGVDLAGLEAAYDALAAQAPAFQAQVLAALGVE